MTIDSQDQLWVCLWGGGKVVCVDSQNANILEEIPLPVSQPTSLAFGGGNLDELYITTAFEGLDSSQREAQADAGRVFRCRPGASGRPVVPYHG